MTPAAEHNAIRRTLLDREIMTDYLRRAATKFAAERGMPPTYLKVAVGLSASNVRRIHKFSESPIEKMLFCSLAACFAIDDPVGLLIVPGLDTPAAAKQFYNLLPQMGNHLHLCLNPTLSREGSKNMRPDGLFFVPSSSRFKPVIVECDGFEFHSSKESFLNDRKRDRLLQSHSYRVLRYSGSEIHADPSGVA